MNGMLVQQPMTWAEDRATVGTDPSAGARTKTERRAMLRHFARLSFTPFGIGAKAKNPLWRGRESLTVKYTGDRLPEFHDSDRQKLQFALIHYIAARLLASRQGQRNNDPRRR